MKTVISCKIETIHEISQVEIQTTFENLELRIQKMTLTFETICFKAALEIPV